MDLPDGRFSLSRSNLVHVARARCRTPALLVCALLVCGCGSAADSEPDPLEGVSTLDLPVGPAAQVEIVQPRDSLAFEWLSLEADPVVLVDMAGEDQDAVGADLRHVAVHPAGYLFIGDPYSRSIRRLTGEGEVDLAWGREGGGPHEFRWILWLDVDPEGRLAVHDRVRSRLTLWSPHGELLTESRVPPMLTQLRGDPRAILPDGSIVFLRPIRPETGEMTAGERYQMDPELFAWTWDDSMTPRRLGTVPGPFSTLVTGREAGGFRAVPNFFFSPQTVAFGGGGKLFLLHTGRGVLEVLDFDGSEPRSRRVIDVDIFADGEERVDERDAALEREARLAALRPRDVGQPIDMARTTIHETPYHPLRPRTGEHPVASGPDAIWISAHRSLAEQTDATSLKPWCRIDLASLRVAPCARLPANQEVLGLLHEGLLVRETLEFGLQRLLLWRWEE